MLISIFASVGAANLGDELIVKNQVKLLRKKYGPQTQFVVFTYDVESHFFEDDGVDYLEYFPCNIKNPKNWMRNIGNFVNFLTIVYKSNLIVVGGGGLFFDHEIQSVTNPLNQWAFRSYFFRLFKKRVLFNAVGLNIKNPENYKKIENIFLGNCEITVRDQYSHDLLKKLFIESQIVNDPVFFDGCSDKEALKNKVLIKEIEAKKMKINDFQNIDFSGKKVGLALRMGFIADEEENINKLISFIQSKGGKVVLIPHSFHPTDILANDFRFLRGFAFKHDLKIYGTMEKSYAVYTEKKIDICVAMRLHSIILSQVYGIPYIALSYSKKTDQIVKNIQKKAK